MANDVAVESKTLTYQEPISGPMVAAAEAVLASVQEISIDSEGAYTAYAEELRDINGSVKQIDEFRESLKRPFLEGGRAIDNLFRVPLEKRREAAGLVNKALTTYRSEQKRIADALQAEADRLAREERERLAAEAKRLEGEGKTEEAEAVKATAAVTTAPIIAAAVPKVAGVHGRKVWKATKIDVLAVLTAIVANPEHMAQHLEGFEVKQSYWDRLATMYHDAHKVPGVTFEQVETTTTRR